MNVRNRRGELAVAVATVTCALIGTVLLAGHHHFFGRVLIGLAVCILMPCSFLLSMNRIRGGK
jgi:type IV secretory pathway VirB2 component (pilin)